jgi:hypothetical protein
MGRSRFRPLLPSLLTLGVMAAALAGIIGLELRKAALDEVPTPVVPARQQPEKPPAPTLSNMSGDQAARYVGAILARPLFSPNRRPDDIAANSPAKDLARLTGVLLSPAGKSAIFAGPAGGKPIVVGEGGRIGEHVVGSINAGAVTVIGPAGERVLHPAFDPSPPPPKQVLPTPITQPIIIPSVVPLGPAAPAARHGHCV